MQCSKCPDREVCFQFDSIAENSRDIKQIQEAYMRTLRCRRQKFGI